MKSIVNFADEKLKKSYKELANSRTEGRILYEWISRAIDDLEKDAFCGIQVPKRLIPREYVSKYGVDNLWKYDFPKGWRLLYSVVNGEISILSVILEWMDHKEYERRFNY